MEMFQKIIQDIAKKNGIEFKTFSRDWIIRLTKNNVSKYIIGMAFSLNDMVTGSIIKDKYATYALLKDANVPIIEHNLQYPSSNSKYISDLESDEAIENYLNKQQNKMVVVKANKGHSGTEVYRASTLAEIKDILDELFITNYSASICPFYEIDTEYRLVYLNGKCKLIYGKKTGEDSWKHNICQGSIVVDKIDEELQEKLKAVAENALKVIPAKFVTVDIIKTFSNEFFIMEINSAVSLIRYSELSDEKKENVINIYEEAVLAMFE